MSADIEQLVLSYIIHSGEIAPILDGGITEEFFPQQRWGDAWRWTYRYWTDHNTVPSITAYTRRFPQPSFKLVETDEPVSALIAELRDRRLYDITLVGMQDAIESFDVSDIKGTLEHLSTLLATANTQVSTSKVVSASLFIGGSILDYIERKHMTLVGIPTGFPTIDTATGGLQPEQLVTLIGLPKTFKTSIAIAIGLAAQRSSKHSMLMSFEMSTDEIQQRYVSLGAGVNLNKIMRGGMTAPEIEKLYDFETEVVDSEGEFTIVHDRGAMATVGRIAALSEQYKPDEIIIDGAYMMHDELGEKPGSPQAITNITRSLKRLAQVHHLPIILTTQAIFSRTSKRKGTQADSAMYSSSWQQDSDVYLGIDRPDYESTRCKLKVIFARNALGKETEISADYEAGYIGEESSGYRPHPKDDGTTE